MAIQRVLGRDYTAKDEVSEMLLDYGKRDGTEEKTNIF